MTCVKSLCRLLAVAHFFGQRSICRKDEVLLQEILRHRFVNLSGKCFYMLNSFRLQDMAHPERAWGGVLLEAQYGTHNSLKLRRKNAPRFTLGRGELCKITNTYVSRLHCSVTLPDVSELCQGFICTIHVKGMNGVVFYEQHGGVQIVKNGYKIRMKYGDRFELGLNTNIAFKVSYLE